MMDCLRKIGIPDGCIKSFTNQNYSKDTYKNVSKDPAKLFRECTKWQDQDKNGKKAKKCIALAKGSRITSRRLCPKWILDRCGNCQYAMLLMYICYPICKAAYGC